MHVDCIYVTNTEVGDLCTLLNKECIYLQNCKEPEWEYYSRMATNYREENNGQS